MNKNYEKFASVYDAIMDDSLYDTGLTFRSAIFQKIRKNSWN